MTEDFPAAGTKEHLVEAMRADSPALNLGLADAMGISRRGSSAGSDNPFLNLSTADALGVGTKEVPFKIDASKAIFGPLVGIGTTGLKTGAGIAPLAVYGISDAVRKARATEHLKDSGSTLRNAAALFSTGQAGKDARKGLFGQSFSLKNYLDATPKNTTAGFLKTKYGDYLGTLGDAFSTGRADKALTSAEKIANAARRTKARGKIAVAIPLMLSQMAGGSANILGSTIAASSSNPENRERGIDIAQTGANVYSAIKGGRGIKDIHKMNKLGLTRGRMGRYALLNTLLPIGVAQSLPQIAGYQNRVEKAITDEGSSIIDAIRLKALQEGKA